MIDVKSLITFGPGSATGSSGLARETTGKTRLEFLGPWGGIHKKIITREKGEEKDRNSKHRRSDNIEKVETEHRDKR
jgi:hypothetical protein